MWNINKDSYKTNRLLDENDKMCCLGFYCNQIQDKSRSSLFSKEMPSHVGVTIFDSLLLDEEDKKKYNGFSHYVVHILAVLNDNTDRIPKISFQKRKREIKRLFKKYLNLDVVYV